ncbi:MAG: methyltransferase domain-containing protein [Desulfobacterales bacterium]|nr:methyltransferase domain-containing protein [Desulfobacterales bacterium]
MKHKRHDAVRNEYAKLAAQYDSRWAFYVEATNRETLRRLKNLPNNRVLDIGCGTGTLLRELAKEVPAGNLAGIDLCPEMLAVARSKLGSSVKLYESPVENIPFPDCHFDLVVSANAFHYFGSPEKALSEMFRVLQSGGHLVITDWCDDFIACRICDLFLRLIDKAHSPIYGTRECNILLSEAGFEVIALEKYKINWLWGLMSAIASKPRTG